jgi:hypothetical protein
MTEKLITLRILIENAFAARMQRDDRGQGALEYVGAVLIGAAIIIAVAAVMKGTDFGTKVGDQVKKVLDIK